MKRQRFLKLLVVLVIICGTPATVNCAENPKIAESEKSATIKLGDSNDFDRTGEVLLTNRNAWGLSGKDRGISYRELKPNAIANVLFAAAKFDVDEDGLCKNDLILEVFYRDHIKSWINESKEVQNKHIIKSQIDFAKDNEYFEVGHLETTGDNKWKITHIFLERTPRQMIRAINGSFRIQIVNSLLCKDRTPVSYIKLRAAAHEELVKLRDSQRARRGLRRVEFEPDLFEQQGHYQPERNLVVYPVNYLEQVYPKSPVNYERVDEELKCFEIPGEVEPVSLVIHAYEDLKSAHLVVSDLRFNNHFIAADNIDVRRVIFNDQRWGWMTDSRYGSCPDYLGFKNPNVHIEADSNCQFWLTVKVPQTTTPGLYKGQVRIYANNKQMQTIAFSVDVLPNKLLVNQVHHMVYHSPYLKKFHKDPVKVLKDMKEHRVVPIFYPPLEIISVKGRPDVKLKGFERQLQEFKSVYPNAKKLFVGFFNYGIVWDRLNGPKPPFTRPFPKFDLVYGKILMKYANLAKHYGLELYFSFNDEPFKHVDRRRISYLCSLIAQSNGLKTWSTHNLDYDIQLPLTEDEIKHNINYLRPLRDVLDVFAEAFPRMNETSIKIFQKEHSNLSYYTTYLATNARPVYNRLIHGLYPFVTGSRFVLSYAYRDALCDPYDDMDVRAIYPYAIGTNDYLLTYPTWRGDILPTLSYEALREGVEDSHLISTLQILADKALKSSDPNMKNLGKKAQVYLDNVLKRLSKNFKTRYWDQHKGYIEDPMEEAILIDLNAQEKQGYEIFDIIRRQICDKIIALQYSTVK